ncbi:protein lifeguard 1 [Scleropages formosus]|uniref:Protein lifeguard 1-like n=1 Tax=Scleropages formosus TaxID=113540 RepID=A0A8C9QSR2_SCLFO|nr:protein lifeguard 1-like [Scleropages formosus]XP_018618396.1 protein lifeguard 1-like [Scleropages formosus]XP_029101779.1 protein lifeguard 1-like [Scleropages formosus]
MAKNTTVTEDLPPPYNYNGYPQQPAPPETFQVAPGNMAMGSVGGDCAGNAEGQTPGAPPAYSEGLEDFSCFSDAAIRRGFVRKVYLTLMVQLLVTTAIICAFLYWHELRVWTIHSTWFTYTMLAIVFALILVLSCCGNLRRKVPLNFIFLALFTAAEGLALGSVTVFYEAEAVLWAVGATAFVSFALSVFAMQTKWDFTALSGSLWAICWSLVTFGILCAILRSHYLYIVYASLGTLIFSVYLVIDTQFMLGGKHRYSVSPEEYIFVALNLYLDIVSLFLFILQLFGLSR